MTSVRTGVKTEGEVYSQPRQPTKFRRSLNNPAAWTYIWVGGAFLYLVSTYLGIVRISRIG